MSCIQIKITEFINLKLLWFSIDCQHMKINIQHTIIDLFVLTKAPKNITFSLVIIFLFTQSENTNFFSQNLLAVHTTEAIQGGKNRLILDAVLTQNNLKKVILLKRKEKGCFWKRYDTSWLVFFFTSPYFCP